MRNRRVRRPPSLSEIQVALEVSGTRRKMNYSAGLFSERKKTTTIAMHMSINLSVWALAR